MRRLLLWVALTAFLTDAALADDAHAFASTYIQRIGAIELMREQAQAEPAPGVDKTVECIRNSERMRLELIATATTLSKFTLRDVYKDIPENMADIFVQKADIWGRLGELCSKFVAGPVDGINHQQFAAEMPKLNAQLEYVDRTLFNATPLVFAVLIDERPNANNELDHLLITKAERNELLRSITLLFIKSIDNKEMNYVVASARTLKELLISDYKSSDDPW